MIGVVYIKIVMILFMTAPLLSWLLGADGFMLIFCYLVPSGAAFEGIMNLANGLEEATVRDVFVLAVHCVVWSWWYLKNFRQTPGENNYRAQGFPAPLPVSCRVYKTSKSIA